MKKLIKIDFDNTTRERKTENSYSELYSHDKNNGLFEFEILNDTLTTEQVTALFKFTESNKIWKTTGTVEGNKVHVTFDTTLITQNETVICYLYFDEEQRTSDTFRFKFKVKVSEIDKMNRYEVKERFINNTVIVDRLDVVTKTELQEALKNVGGIATEGLLTEVKAEEIYAKKSEAVDNTNFELVKNRVLALELKTDKDTVYDDSEVKERLTTLENKSPVDLSNYATKEELRNISGSQPNVDNLVTKEELEAKHYISDVSNLATKEELQEVRNSQSTVDTSNLVTRDELESKGYVKDLSEYAKKSELYNDSDLKARVEVLEQKTDKDTVYDDTPLKERVTALESKAIEGGAYDDKPIRDRLDVLEAKHDNDTIYDDTEVKNRLTELESKPAVDTSVFVTDEKLASKGYLTQHQDLSPYALKSEIPQPYNDSPLTERVTALENRPTTGGSIDTSNLVTKTELKDYHYVTIEELPIPLYEQYTTDDFNEYFERDKSEFINSNTHKKGKVYIQTDSDYRTTSPLVYTGDSEHPKTAEYDAILYSVANSLPDGYSLETLNEDNKVTFLSNKNFSEVVPKEELKNIIREVGESTGSNIDTSNLATKEELAKAVTKEELEAKHYVTTDELNNKGYLTTHQRLDNVVTKEELATKGYITDVSNLVTKEELESKNYLTTPYNDTPLKERVTNLENKPNVDLSNYVTNEQLENKHYLTQHQELTHLATTSDLEALRNIAVSKSELSKKLDTTEFNTFKDNVVTKTELAEKGYISDLSNYVTKQELHEATEIDYSNIVTTDELEPYAKKSELPQPYNDSALVSRVTALESKTTTNQTLPANQFEIHGTGMPNGVVEAEIGTTYVDKNKTNGALKWIKTTDGGNTGWEVLIGDTGWRTLNSVSKLKVGDRTSFIKIRRVNNLVTYQFGGLQWGWFGIIRRNGAGFLKHNSSGDKGAKVLGVSGIPEGFRSESSLIGGIYSDAGKPYGIWYLGGKSDSNFIQFTFNDPIPTDRDIGDIRVSAISYLTEEPWPTQLP
jgi:hypothetical protein|nr:MAG TPA: hypothetical protein [Caudoviricetes sp.]